MNGATSVPQLTLFELRTNIPRRKKFEARRLAHTFYLCYIHDPISHNLMPFPSTATVTPCSGSIQPRFFTKISAEALTVSQDPDDFHRFGAAAEADEVVRCRKKLSVMNILLPVQYGKLGSVFIMVRSQDIALQRLLHPPKSK